MTPAAATSRARSARRVLFVDRRAGVLVVVTGRRQDIIEAIASGYVTSKAIAHKFGVTQRHIGRALREMEQDLVVETFGAVPRNGQPGQKLLKWRLRREVSK